MNKNNNLLNDFNEYCTEHPEERFWQALRNWSGFGYIWVSNAVCRDPNCTDTFYWDEKTTKIKKKKKLLM